MRHNGDVSINLKAISITLLTIFMITTWIYVAVFNSLFIQIVILVSILTILLFNELIRKQKYFFEKTDMLLLLTIFVPLASLNNSMLTTNEVAGPVIFSLGILISFFVRGDVRNYNSSINLIKWGGVFFGLSVIFSYLFPVLYNNLFLSQLRPIFVERILIGMENGYYTGFTSQVGLTAGYIVNGIGIIFCSWIINRHGKSKKEILLFLIMFLALLLTQKRGHLLLMVLTIFFVYIQYSSFNYERFKKMFKAFYFSIFVIVFFIIITLLTNIGDTLFLRVIATIEALFAGEDITSNRNTFWLFAWGLFVENPLFGIGWGNFKDTVIGNVTVHTKMDVHNIYLQLLSETGIVGSMLILTPFFLTYFYTIKTTRMINRNKSKYSSKWEFAVLYSLYTQTFFLLYGLTGNPLYDYSYFIMYCLAFGLIYSFWNFNKKAVASEKV
ncbi:O-antigen ligase family protein [Alteribacter aurantiacus]|uniref:O-antigen ligase family protein n=1 Tax=Alteribacter aurantiacus TaxID=254410 RepID=UPI0003FB1CF7|nr:O-antigen ligase family protein [Alteribacter aurantiacus]